MIKHIQEEHHPYEKVYQCPLGCLCLNSRTKMTKQNLYYHLQVFCDQMEIDCTTCNIGSKRFRFEVHKPSDCICKLQDQLKVMDNKVKQLNTDVDGLRSRRNELPAFLSNFQFLGSPRLSDL